MFYWLFYTTATENYTERPLIVWLQGGPGGSSTGIGNFEILGPQDVYLQNRNYTWVRTSLLRFRLLFKKNELFYLYLFYDLIQLIRFTKFN